MGQHVDVAAQQSVTIATQANNLAYRLGADEAGRNSERSPPLVFDRSRLQVHDSDAGANVQPCVALYAERL